MLSRRHPGSRERGSVLLAVAVIALLASLGATLLQRTVADARSTRAEQDRVAALAAADLALSEALARIAGGDDATFEVSGTTGEGGRVAYSATAAPDGDGWGLVARGQAGGATRVVSAVAVEDDGTWRLRGRREGSDQPVPAPTTTTTTPPTTTTTPPTTTTTPPTTTTTSPPTTTTTAPAGPAFTPSVEVFTDWGSGYCANVTVSTTWPTPVAWEVVIDLRPAPYGGTPYNVWNATWSMANGVMTASGVGWNSLVSAGQTQPFGFCANR